MVVHTFEEYEDNLDPYFEKEINMTLLCDKNDKLPLKFTLYSLVDKENGRKLPYGSMTTTLFEIKQK